VSPEKLEHLFDENSLNRIFPGSISDRFFDALFGDSEEGAYDIRLAFNRQEGNKLEFHFELARRPDKCLRCSLTYGLPDVFLRHPVINLKGLAGELEKILDGKGKIDHWKIGKTIEVDADLHIIPLTLFLKN
jgi:hypothetical protein